MKHIREWRMDDTADLAAALNNKKIQDNLRDGLPYPYTEQDAAQYITSVLEGQEGRVYAFAIQNKEGRAVGSVGIHRQENIHRLTGEIGYYLAEEYWGQDIVTGAVREACKYVFDNTDILRIYAEPYFHNFASCRVLEKAGFVYEGTLRKNAIKNGQVIDMKIYSLIR